MPYGAMPGYGKIGDDGVTANTRGTLLTAAATANTKGTYSTIVASTAFAVHGIVIRLTRCATAADFLVDIAIGGAGSETIIAADLVTGSGTGITSRTGPYFIPLSIPAGTRISARCQSTTLSATVDIKVHLLGDLAGGMDGYGKCIRYGAVAATSQMTTVDPGATANTKGAYTTIVASTTYALKALVIDASNLVQTTRTSCFWMVDIAVGAAASEAVVIPNLQFECGTTEDTIVHTPSILLPISIPQGTRLSARAACSINTATIRNIPIGILAFS